MTEPKPVPDPPRLMRLPKNSHYPNYSETHPQDAWCASVGCTPVEPVPAESRPTDSLAAFMERTAKELAQRTNLLDSAFSEMRRIAEEELRANTGTINSLNFNEVYKVENRLCLSDSTIERRKGLGWCVLYDGSLRGAFEKKSDAQWWARELVRLDRLVPCPTCGSPSPKLP